MYSATTSVGWVFKLWLRNATRTITDIDVWETSDAV